MEEIKMTNEQLEKRVATRMSLCANTLLKKGKEYNTSTDDRLSAFKAAAALENVNPAEALGGMLAKHLVSIYDMLPHFDYFSPDTWEEKIGDAINYLLILDALICEDNDMKCVCTREKNEEN